MKAHSLAILSQHLLLNRRCSSRQRIVAHSQGTRCTAAPTSVPCLRRDKGSVYGEYVHPFMPGWHRSSLGHILLTHPIAQAERYLVLAITQP